MSDSGAHSYCVWGAQGEFRCFGEDGGSSGQIEEHFKGSGRSGFGLGGSGAAKHASKNPGLCSKVRDQATCIAKNGGGVCRWNGVPGLSPGECVKV